MIEQELLFLGLLMDGPKHGYEIKRRIETFFGPALGLHVKSIYYPLKKMEEKGWVEKSRVPNERFPDRWLYHITPHGRRRFEEQTEKRLTAVERPYFDLDLSLYFLSYIPQQKALRRLRTRQRYLRRIAAGLASLIETGEHSETMSIILHHNAAMIKAEIDFLDGLIVRMLKKDVSNHILKDRLHIRSKR